MTTAEVQVTLNTLHSSKIMKCKNVIIIFWFGRMTYSIELTV